MKSNNPPPRQRQGCMGKTFSMTRLPPKRVTNSAGEATVKSRCRSIFLCSRPLFARCSPDMLGLRQDVMAISKPAVARANLHRARLVLLLDLASLGVGSAESPAACSSGHWRPDGAPSTVSSKESNKTLHPAGTHREHWDSPSSLPDPCHALGSLQGHLTLAVTPQRKSTFD